MSVFLSQQRYMYEMKIVYLLQSIKNPRQNYVGITGNLRNRMKDHNSGKSSHTSKYKPWELKIAVRFKDDFKAQDFERYLKSGSGRAFAKRHFW
jgi:putative endonuclease